MQFNIIDKIILFLVTAPIVLKIFGGANYSWWWALSGLWTLLILMTAAIIVGVLYNVAIHFKGG